jgi:peptidoglycan/LPS O-acetylase OafA/YrhL
MASHAATSKAARTCQARQQERIPTETDSYTNDESRNEILPAASFMSFQKDCYLPSLDGMRALAVTLVFVSHAGWGRLVPGGFGVTVFFFLSGYLITTLLRIEYEQYGSLSLRQFYLRRAYRILPPMYLVLFGILLLQVLGLVEGETGTAGLLAQVLQATNYYALFAHHPSIVPFTGTFWSLAVEEHFYLIFPAILLFCLRRYSYSSIALVFLAGCALELCWRCLLVFGFDATDMRTYMATDTRLDNMLFGCIMGIWMNPALDKHQVLAKSTVVKAAMLAGAVAVLLASFVVRGDGFRETLRYSLQGLALFPVFWLAVRHADWPLFRILNTKPLKYFGQISYVFYLSHYFFLHVAARFIPEMKGAAIAAFGVSLLFSAAMHSLVERPFARLRRRLHSHAPSPAAKAALPEPLG